jgi:glycosyltransferase involved in cell wall biosynthesis
MTIDITIYAYLWGDTHNHHVDPWAEAISRLDPQPAEVIVATDPDNPAKVDHLPYRIIRTPMRRHDITGAVNTIIKTAQTEWIGACDIDDRLFPDALTPITYAEGYDACANNVMLKSTGAILASRPERFHVEPRKNHVMVNSYFTKDIWCRVGGHPKAILHDWVFWWKLHKHNARWFPSPGVQMLYDDTPNENRATDNLPNYALQEALEFIRTYDPTNPKD